MRWAARFVFLMALVFPVGAQAQMWSVDVAAGRAVYDPVATGVGTSNLSGTVRYDAVRGAWVYASAAAPLGEGDSAWGALGVGSRVTPAGSEGRRTTLGLDVSADAFVFRDAVASYVGRGATLTAIPFVSVAAGDADLEVRAGWRGHTLTAPGATERRGLVETGVRAAYGRAVQVRGEATWWHTGEAIYPFVGGAVSYAGPAVQVWAGVGKGLHNDLDDTAWNAGAQFSLGARSVVWTRVGLEAPDPLYWNAPRRIWSLGVTRSFGRSAPTRPRLPAPDGPDVVIRVLASTVPDAPLFVAGDFNGWRPMAMNRDGGDWLIRLSLDPGVYHYAFRSGGDEWFVPSSVAGRRDDGMGGHVAVLVVN